MNRRAFLTFPSHLTSAIVPLAVGPHGRIFMVHKALVADIPYFYLHFRSHDLNVAEPIFGLPCSPLEIELFMPFLYGRPLEGPELSKTQAQRLLPLHELCDMWGTARHANSVMAALVAWTVENRGGGVHLLTKGLVKQTYDRTTMDSKLRKFLVWYACYNGVGIEVDLEWLVKIGRWDARFASNVGVYSTRLQDKEVEVREIAISGLRGSLFLGESGYLA